jgi:hypothetical protein
MKNEGSCRVRKEKWVSPWAGAPRENRAAGRAADLQVKEKRGWRKRLRGRGEQGWRYEREEVCAFKSKRGRKGGARMLSV